MDQDNWVGQKLGKYEVRAEIGRGGMGVVYRGYDPLLDRRVAIKMLPSHLAWQKEFVDRFMREARTAARLRHPNIVTIHDVGQAEDDYYFVMEYLEGQSLTDLIQQRGPLPPATVYSMLRPLAKALDYAHRQGLIHRDVKPANVIVSPTNQVTITDFGIARAAQEARLTATGAIVGTPEYMSPEQAKGEEVDARTDQYSLAVVAYEMLSGEAPFQAESTMALLYKITQEPPPPIRSARPELPAAVETVLNRALSKNPNDRYPSVTAFVESLSQALAGKAVVAPPPSTQVGAPTRAVPREEATVAAPSAPPRRPARPRSRVPAWGWALVGLLLLALVAGGWLLFGGGAPRPTPTPPPTAVAVATATSTATSTATPSSTPSPSTTETPDVAATDAAATLFAAATTVAAPTPTSTATPTSPPTPTATRTPRATRTRTPTATTRATATATARPQATTPPTTSGALIDFEQMGTWRRGDQPHGELTQTREQVHSGNYAAKLRYDLPASDEDFVVFLHKLNLSGQPNQVGAWVYGDGSNHFVNVWVQDAQNEIWSVSLGQVGGTGWRQMVGTLAPGQPWPSGHISGPDNGAVDYPVRFYALVLDRPGSGPRSGQIYVDDISVWRGQPSAGGTATPVAGTPTPSPSGDIGRILFTVKAGDAYYLYSTDPAWSQMVQVGPTDWPHSTCSGTSASTLEGLTINLYGVNKCDVTDSVSICLSPDGQYKVVTDRVNGGHTVALWRASDNAILEGYYHGPLNKAAGIQWSPDSRRFLFTINRSVHIAQVGSAGYLQIIPEIDDAWPPQFAPDGSLIYYLKPVGSEGAVDVLAVNPDGSNLRNLTNAPSTHKLCPRWER